MREGIRGGVVPLSLFSVLGPIPSSQPKSQSLLEAVAASEATVALLPVVYHATAS